MKSRAMTIAIVVCAVILSISVIDPTRVMAQRTSSTSARQQQVLVKRINQGARRFYKVFIRQSLGTTPTSICELNDLLENFLLAVDGLTDSRYLRHNLVVVMQIASDIEQELLWVNISSNVVTAWSRLHADLDRLAKIHGIKWSEAVITNALIAALASDLNTVSEKVQNELSPFQAVSTMTSVDLPVLLARLHGSAQELRNSSVDELHYQLQAVRNHARAVTTLLNNHVISSALESEWRRVTSRFEELIRLYSLDSIELRTPPKITIGAMREGIAQ